MFRKNLTREQQLAAFRAFWERRKQLGAIPPDERTEQEASDYRIMDNLLNLFQD